MNESAAAQSVRRATVALMVAQSIASAGLLTMSTTNAINISRLTGSETWAGVPNTLVLSGAALAAFFAGQITGKIGRRNALFLGSIFGVIGALIASIGIINSSLFAFLPGLFLIGCGRGSLEQGRYAAAEINPPANRARALSTVVWGSTVGSVLGPLLASPAGDFVNRTFGLPQLSGAPLLTMALIALAGMLIAILLRGVDFRSLAARYDTKPTGDSQSNTHQASVLKNPAARTSLIVMACAQSAMVLMMTIISLHMVNHNHTLGEVGNVITGHVLGMYLFSPLVGRLVDRVGRRNSIIIGASVLAAGCIVTAMTLMTPIIILGEFLVGLGWSIGYISGSSLLSSSMSSAQRLRSQGTVDMSTNFAAAIGGLSSGFLLKAFDFVPLSIVGLIVSLLPLLVVQNASPAQKKTIATA